MNTNKKIARIAGILYLLHFVTFFIADNGVHFTGVGAVDMDRVASTIAANPGLFQTGFVSFILTAVFFFLAAWALYVLLKPVNKDAALLFLLLNLGGTVIWCAILFAEYAAMLVLQNPDYLAVFQPQQVQALAILSLNVYQHGYMIAQLVLNLWLFPLGYLVYKSGFVPKVFGVLLLVDGLAMLTWFVQFFLFPGFEVVSMISLGVSFLAEGTFCLWLLIKGTRDRGKVAAMAG